MAYKSKFTGKQIDDYLDVVSDLSSVATSGDYNDLSNTPSVVTEEIIDEGGFTKNTGTVTGIQVNGETKSPQDGVVDLGTVVSSIKTINEESILGEGNLNVHDIYYSSIKISAYTFPTTVTATVEEVNALFDAYDNKKTICFGSISCDRVFSKSMYKVINDLYINCNVYKTSNVSPFNCILRFSKNSDKCVVYYHQDSCVVTTSEEAITAYPYITYICTSSTTVDINLNYGIHNTFAEFKFIIPGGITVSLPSTIKWQNGLYPDFAAGYTYEISMFNGLGCFAKFENE